MSRVALAALLLLASRPAFAGGPEAGVALLRSIDALTRGLADAARLEDAAARRAAAARLVASHLDSAELARVCTRRLSDLSRQERAELGEFLTLRVSHNLGAWLEPEDPQRRPRRIEGRREALEITGDRAKVVVGLRIDGRPETRVELHLLRGPGGWKAWDVRARGLHLSRQFGAHLRQMYAGGGAIELMTRIRRHTQPERPAPATPGARY